MNTPSPAIQNLARQLLADEPARVEHANGDPGRAVQAVAKLRVPLAKLIGAAGFSSLLARALSLAQRQAPSLKGVRVQPNGSLVGFDAVHRDSSDGGVILVAELLDLLVTFIGQPMTLSLVREVWPDASIDAVTPRTEETS
jgi:hypothetical protein